MNALTPNRGATKIGLLRDLDPVEIGAVLYLRMWCNGPDAQAQVWSDFAQTLGPARGRHALKSLETLCQVITDHARRPVMRHEVTCACLGADEAIFAHFIAASGAGEREEAMMFAMLLVRADFAPLMLAEAEALALALKQIHQIETRHAARPRTLH